MSPAAPSYHTSSTAWPSSRGPSLLTLTRVSAVALAWIPLTPAFCPVASRPPVSSRSTQVLGALKFWEGLDASFSRPKEVKDILAIDFDGVICDSADEQSRAAFRSVKKLWPQVAMYCGAASGNTDEIPPWLLETLRQLRPVVETGYETVLLARMCIEQYLQASGQPGAINVKEIAATWHDKIRSNLLQRYGVSAQELVDAFGSVREDWMTSDRAGWVAANRLFAGVDLPIGHCRRFETYIVTTKQARYVEAILQARGLAFPRDRIFGLGSGPTTDVLARLVRAQRERASGDKAAEREAVVHFVEDRVETLEKVCADPRLQNVRLYMADWGYTTKDQMQRAFFNPRIRTIDLTDFSCFCRFQNIANDFACFVPTVRNRKLTPEKVSFSPRKEDTAESPSPSSSPSSSSSSSSTSPSSSSSSSSPSSSGSTA